MAHGQYDGFGIVLRGYLRQRWVSALTRAPNSGTSPCSNQGWRWNHG